MVGPWVDKESALQVEISARHGQLSGAAREKITSKVERLARFYDRVTAICVTVDLERESEPEVEIRVAAERTDDFVGKERASSLHGAVDQVIHKLEQQIRRHKERLVDHRHGKRGGASGRSDTPDTPSADTDAS